MKKLIALLLALLCIVVTVSACEPNGKEEETTAAPREEATTAKPATPPTETESETFEDQDGQRFGEIHGVQG